MMGFATTPFKTRGAVLEPLEFVAVTVIVVELNVAGTAVELMAQVELLMV